MKLKLSLATVLLLISIGLLLYQNHPVFVKTTLRSYNILTTEDNSQLSKKEVSLNSIFESDHSQIASSYTKETITLIATGDIIPARSVNYEVLQHKDFKWPYLNTYKVTQDADITFSNLESPQIKNCPITNEGMIFCGDKRNIVGLKFAGIDVVSLANNHAGNHGEDGVLETVGYLKEVGIEATGTSLSNLVIKEVKGVKFAFLGFNDISKNQPGVSNVEEQKIKDQIAKAKQVSDVVIVTFHWGEEYKAQPDKRQKYLGHLTIDSGADLVIGNHPHWLQPVEFYKDKLITYAHGNFVFDQEWSLETKQGVLGKYIFLGKKLVDVEYIPLQIEDYGQPKFLEGDRKNSILQKMYSESKKLNDK